VRDDDAADQQERLAALEADAARKREARRRDREASAARQSAADRELLDKLIAATGGNFVPGPGIQDVSPIKAALELVPLVCVLGAVRNKTHKLLCPVNLPATSWREKRLLEAIAQRYCRHHLIPGMIDAWSKAGKAPGKPLERVEPSAGAP
jgi:hypothetical protein